MAGPAVIRPSVGDDAGPPYHAHSRFSFGPIIEVAVLFGRSPFVTMGPALLILNARPGRASSACTPPPGSSSGRAVGPLELPSTTRPTVILTFAAPRPPGPAGRVAEGRYPGAVSSTSVPGAKDLLRAVSVGASAWVANTTHRQRPNLIMVRRIASSTASECRAFLRLHGLLGRHPQSRLFILMTVNLLSLRSGTGIKRIRLLGRGRARYSPGAGSRRCRRDECGVFSCTVEQREAAARRMPSTRPRAAILGDAFRDGGGTSTRPRKKPRRSPTPLESPPARPSEIAGCPHLDGLWAPAELRAARRIGVAHLRGVSMGPPFTVAAASRTITPRRRLRSQRPTRRWSLALRTTATGAKTCMPSSGSTAAWVGATTTAGVPPAFGPRKIPGAIGGGRRMLAGREKIAAAGSSPPDDRCSAPDRIW